MLPYYKILEDPKNFKIYLNNIYVNNYKEKIIYKDINDKFLRKYQTLFPKLAILDKLINNYGNLVNSNLYKNDYEIMNMFWEFYSHDGHLKDHYEFSFIEEDKTNYIMQKICNNITFQLEEDLFFCDCFIEAYKGKTDFFLNLKKEIEMFLNDYEEKIVYQLNKPSKMIEHNIPNGWYFTKNGFLYNPDGKVGSSFEGHKEGNLRHYLDYIKKSFSNNITIGDIYYDKYNTYKEYLDKIIKNGFVTEIDFKIYANLVYNFPSVLTKDILEKIKFKDKVINLKTEEYKTLIIGDKQKTIIRELKDNKFLIDLINWSSLKVSYQPNLNTLVKGYLDAIISLNESFSKLNTSNNKRNIIKKIYDLSYNDILVRFCGFSKIETCEKKIVTANLKGIEIFKNYLDKGFELYIIPKLVYDKYLDDVSDMNFNSYYIRNYLENILENYHGKSKVLIKDINC